MSNDGAEKTESATSRRREKERDKGNIPKSQDLSSAVMVTAGVALMSLFSSSVLTNLQTLLRETFSNLNPKDINTQNITVILFPFVHSMAQILLPILISLVIIAIAVVRAQVGPVFAVEKIKFDLGNIAPSKILQSAKKMFNPVEPRTMVEFVKSIIKLLVVGGCGFSVINGRKDELFGLLGASITTGFGVIGSILSNMLINMCLAMLVIGIIDRRYQIYEYEKGIKMTKQEVKDEMKDTEGDPKIKSKIRSVQMQMMQQKMMANIPTADVVVTNPTHYAVAIKYDRMKAPAPVVVAKGVDFVAFKIREIAEANNVPIVENKPLARALYKLVKIDDIIPSEMFVAVAEVLAYVYNKNKKK